MRLWTHFLMASVLVFQVYAKEIHVKKDPDLMVECFKTPKGHAVDADYCISQYPDRKQGELLYFFHGIFGSEKNWPKQKQWIETRKQWRSLGGQIPAMVSISLGRTFLLTPKSTSEKSGLLEMVVEKLLPHIEKKHFSNKDESIQKPKRLIAGISMGGFNAAQIVLRYPKMFKKLALFCPAFATTHPYVSADEVDDFINRTGAHRSRVMLALYLAKQYFANAQDYLADAPLQYYAKNMKKLKLPPIHLTNNQYDEYGFYEGGSFFKQKIEQTRSDFDYTELAGGHCDLDPIDIARFLN